MLALLAGTAPAAVALPKIMPNQVHVDWRQARRFGIDAEAVPADAVVSFKEPSFWEAYGHFVLIAGAVMLVQSGLIARAADRAAPPPPHRLRAGAERTAHEPGRAGGAAVDVELGPRPRQMPVRAPARRSTDHLPDAFTDFKEVLASIDPQDRPTVQHAVDRALASGEEMDVEYRVATPDGQTRWMAARGRAALGDGRHLLGVALDITRASAPRRRPTRTAPRCAT